MDGYYVLLYDTYCIYVPSLWIDLDRNSFQIPKKHKDLSKACHKKLTPSDDWQELLFQKKFGPFGAFHDLQQLQQVQKCNN